jgi:hypothetical protein
MGRANHIYLTYIMKLYPFFGAWLLLLATAMPAFSQKYDYQLQVKAVGTINKIYFGYWYGGQALLLDSTQIEQSKNTVSFTGSRNLPAGQYFFASNLSTATLDFIINGENNLQFTTYSATAWADSFFVEKSKENTPYFLWKSIKNERELRISTARNMLEMIKKATKDRSVLEEKSRELRRLREEIDSFSRQQKVKYPDLLFAKIIAAETPPAIPAFISPIGKDGQINPAYLQFFRSHFWDGYDFSDERMLYTPVLARKTDDWMQLQPANIDSVKVQLDIALKKATINKKSAQLLLRLLFERLDKPSFGGNETIVVHMFDRYYPSATAAGIDTATWMRMEYKVNAYRPTLPGAMAPPIVLQDTAGNYISLYDFKAKYTLLYFFNPLCSHCIESTPGIYQLTLPYAAKGIKVFAVSTETSPDIWKNYVKTNISEWTCVAEFIQNSPLEKTYATSTLPNLLLLNEDKKVVIRRLPLEELPNVLKMIGK